MSWMLVDIVTVGIIIGMIANLYKKRYGKKASKYISGELDILMIYCLTLIVGLDVYYFLEDTFSLDERYTEGIILIFFYGVIGIISKQIRVRWKNHKSRYAPTNGEILFIIETAFITVSIQMISERKIGWVVPISIILGSLIWVDVSSIKEVCDKIKVNHQRLIETSTLLILGIVIVSVVMWYFDWPRYVRIFIALIYGTIIWGPIEWTRKILIKVCRKSGR